MNTTNENTALNEDKGNSKAQKYSPRLQTLYMKELRPKLAEQLAYKNIMQVPRLDKVCLNMGIGEATSDRKNLEQAMADMERIAGQKPTITRAKNAIAAFKLRQGQGIGCRVTLRKARMYEFIDRLTTIALPRVKDFRGLSRTSFDGRGNYALGLREQIVFPEIEYDKIDKIRGLDIIVCTTANTNNEAIELLLGFNFPFVDAKKSSQ